MLKGLFTDKSEAVEKVKAEATLPPDAIIQNFMNDYSDQPKKEEKNEVLDEVLDTAVKPTVEVGKTSMELPKEAVEQTEEIKENSPVTDLVATGAEQMEALGKKVPNMPTPGGIALLLTIILFILFSIQSARTVGDENLTRMQLLWRVLIGRAKLTTDPKRINEVKTPGGTFYSTEDNPDIVKYDTPLPDFIDAPLNWLDAIPQEYILNPIEHGIDNLMGWGGK